MKKIIYRVIALAIIAVLLTTASTGCRSHTDDGKEVSEFVFLPEITSISSLAENFPNMSNITLTESNLYFTSTSNIDSKSLFRTTQIIKVDLDISDISNLSNYSSLSNYTTALPPHNAEGGGVYINTMQIDTNGNLWIAETSSYVIFDFPSNLNVDDMAESEIWEHHRPLEQSYAIRKLDSTGTELLSVDISSIASANLNWVGITAFHADDESNIIIGSGQTIYVLDIDGNIKFTLNTEEFIHPGTFIRLSDGRVAHRGWSNRQLIWTLRVIDTKSKEWGASIELPSSISGVFHGYDDYLVIFSDLTHLLAIDVETNEEIQILNWMASGIEQSGIDTILFLPDDRILFTTTTWVQDIAGKLSRHTDLMVFSKIPYDEAQEKTIITIATYAPHIISAAVIEFNRTNALYRIEINEIEQSFSALGGDLDKLALEIITGGGPDIIHTAYLPFQQWAGRGIFANLYEFIDADPRLSRSDFIESVISGFESNGKLFHMSPDFTIKTLIGHPDVVGNNTGWSVDDFKAVLDSTPQAMKPLGELYGGVTFLWSIILSDISSFVDWESGNVYFNNDYFIDLLELAYTLEKIVDINWDEIIGGVYSDRSVQMISSGAQIMESVLFVDFWMYFAYQELFGGDFVFKGYPAKNGSGNSLYTSTSMAITTTSQNQQGAWEFIRMFLSEEWQSQQVRSHTFDIPTNKNVFDQSLAKAMEDKQNQFIGWNDLTIAIKALTQEQADDIKELIYSASSVSTFTDPLESIIREGVEDFFNGKITAQDAAQIIQNRALIFVAEQSR